MGWNNIITILSSVIIAGLMVTASVTYVVNNDDDNDNDDKGFDLDDGTLDYVSFGASNTNGYGMRGYISEEDIMNILSGKVSKDDVNVYGYQKTPEGAYPDLIRDHYAAIYGEENVVLDQLAISSMRVEELRIMLDETYDGDSYSQWRFTCEDGWFYAAEEGGLEALRATCKDKVTNADLITVDIGWNNFGVYICNQMMDVMKNGTYNGPSIWVTSTITTRISMPAIRLRRSSADTSYRIWVTMICPGRSPMSSHTHSSDTCTTSTSSWTRSTP